ncbi:hypothetical protein ACVW0J_007445 [Bradyrhizobium sp. i1.7.7]
MAVPIRRSTFSSSTSLRALRVAADGSEPSSTLDQANGLAVDGLPVFIGGIDAAPIGDSDRRAVAAQRGDEADGDVGLRSRRCEESGDKCE